MGFGGSFSRHLLSTNHMLGLGQADTVLPLKILKQHIITMYEKCWKGACCD